MPIPSQADVVDALRKKSKKVTLAAAALHAASQHADATLADQEALNCSGRADAIEAGTRAIQNFPSAADLQQLADDCADLQKAIDRSAAANNLAAAADKVRNNLPASKV